MARKTTIPAGPPFGDPARLARNLAVRAAALLLSAAGRRLPNQAPSRAGYPGRRTGAALPGTALFSGEIVVAIVYDQLQPAIPCRSQGAWLRLLGARTDRSAPSRSSRAWWNRNSSPARATSARSSRRWGVERPAPERGHAEPSGALPDQAPWIRSSMAPAWWRSAPSLRSPSSSTRYQRESAFGLRFATVFRMMVQEI